MFRFSKPGFRIRAISLWPHLTGWFELEQDGKTCASLFVMRISRLFFCFDQRHHRSVMIILDLVYQLLIELLAACGSEAMIQRARKQALQRDRRSRVRFLNRRHFNAARERLFHKLPTRKRRRQ
jgi:hypothetical protein